LSRLSADWLYTGEGEVIPFGSILIDNHGRLGAVGPGPGASTGDALRSEHFHRAVLLPGLVNAHTHLELTGFEGLAGEAEFTDWIRTIIRLKTKRTAGEFLAASTRGLQECFAAGITTVADTGDSGAPFEALLQRNGSGIAYLEVFGPDPAVAPAQFAAFRDRIHRLKERQTDRVRLGISPHAPYSVSGRLYELVARFAEEEQLPVAVHVAESAAESELLEHASGAFAAQWKGREIPLPSLPGRTPLAWLNEHGVLGPHTLCIHAVRADVEDIRRLVGKGCAVAHCPRSNRRHGHGDAPLRDFLSSGLRVGVGTDSAASVAPLDLLAEARAARTLGGLSADQALDLAMQGAARALGMDADLGSLGIGKWADCTVVEVPSGLSISAVPEAILVSRTTDVIATFVGGREVYRRG
jgi:5-methylthioadenosine/S-adenosylhomocysteine deaminase